MDSPLRRSVSRFSGWLRADRRTRQFHPAAAPAGPPPTPTLEQVQSATVSGVFDQAVTLANGKYDGPPAEPGAASRPHARAVGAAVAFGDVDGAPGSEAVAMLSSNSGGSGEFVYVAVFGMRDGQLANLGTAGRRPRQAAEPVARARQGRDGRDRGGPEGCGVLPDAGGPQDLRDGGRHAQAVDERGCGVLALGMLAANEWTLV